MFKLDPYNYVFFTLWIFALHSFGVALGLILLPSEYLYLFGFEGYSGRFFQMQSGVFHIVMATAYLLAAYNIKKSPILINFAIYVKSIATIFLLTVFIFSSGWMVLFSAIVDGIFAIVLYFLYKNYQVKFAD